MSAPIVLACADCHRMNRVPATKLAESPRCGHRHQPLFTGGPLVLGG